MKLTDGCSQRVYSGARWDMRGHMCQKKAVVLRDGVAFCKLHDPVVLAEKKDAESKQRAAMWREEDAMKEEADRLCDALGVPRSGPNFSSITRKSTKHILLSFEDAKRMIERLKR